VYAAGACSGNPGPAGLGVVIYEHDGKRELSEYLGRATNNIAELTAILRAAEALRDETRQIVLKTDSQYSIGVLTKGWKAKANPELIANVKAALAKVPHMKIRYVEGHAGHAGNERADELARVAVTAQKSAGWKTYKKAAG
jgi:ribonuclease HI